MVKAEPFAADARDDAPPVDRVCGRARLPSRGRRERARHGHRRRAVDLPEPRALRTVHGHVGERRHGGLARVQPPERSFNEAVAYLARTGAARTRSRSSPRARRGGGMLALRAFPAGAMVVHPTRKAGGHLRADDESADIVRGRRKSPFVAPSAYAVLARVATDSGGASSRSRRAGSSRCARGGRGPHLVLAVPATGSWCTS